jgi:uncharacterized membrane protein YeiB
VDDALALNEPDAVRTPARSVLVAAFVPLGRLALTNYVTATVLVSGISRLLGGAPDHWSSATALVIAGGVLTIQCVWSTLWPRRHRYGPLEWLWRWVTWARRPALRHGSRSATSLVEADPCRSPSRPDPSSGRVGLGMACG